MFLSEFCCPDCGHPMAFYSRRRTFAEKYILPVFLLRPLRCADCFRRSYWLYFTPAQQPRLRPAAASVRVPPAVPTSGQRVA